MAPWAWGRWRRLTDAGCPVWFTKGHILLSPVGPKLETRPNIRAAGNHWSGPGHLGSVVTQSLSASWMVTGVALWPPASLIPRGRLPGLGSWAGCSGARSEFGLRVSSGHCALYLQSIGTMSSGLRAPSEQDQVYRATIVFRTRPCFRVRVP